MNNPYYFSNENIQIGFKIILDSQNLNHANSILSIIPFYPYFVFETRYIKKILSELATIYARLINHYEFIQHTIFPASVYRIDKVNQRSDEYDFFIDLNINHKLTETLLRILTSNLN